MAEALRAARLRRDAVVVAGPDALGYLQGQLSQDVAGLEVGASAWSWLLQPAGKVDALVRATRTGPDTVVVDVDEGFGEAVLSRLTRFKLRTKADLELILLDVVALRGPGADQAAVDLVAGAADGPGAAGGPAPAAGEGAAATLAATVVGALWSAGEEAADVVGAGTGAWPLPGDIVAVPAGDWEAQRILAGVPAMGAELTERTIPAETGLVAVTASFTKGCYTGQELVARIDSRGGHVARHLRQLRSERPLPVGAELVNGEGKAVGAVTSAAVSPQVGPVALAYLARSVEVGGVVSAGGTEARVLSVALSA